MLMSTFIGGKGCVLVCNCESYRNNLIRVTYEASLPFVKELLYGRQHIKGDNHYGVWNLTRLLRQSLGALFIA